VTHICLPFLKQTCSGRQTFLPPTARLLSFFFPADLRSFLCIFGMMRLILTLFSLALGVGFATAQVPSYTSPPGPQHTGTAAGCSLWAVVNAGDSCDTLSNAFGIPVSQFLTWNPAVSADCITNFWAGYSYCVRVGP
jgi:hypothetical protein